MHSEFQSRQADCLSGGVLFTPITIIGAGAIGSFVALSLAKMGFNTIEVWDDDVVSVENMNCQFYPIDMIGAPKTGALGEVVLDYTGVTIREVRKRFTNEFEQTPHIVISAVDSMEARTNVYNTWKSVSWRSRTHTIIDPRMSIEYAHIQCIDTHNAHERKSYTESLFPDSEAVQERCTNKSIMYTVLTISGLVCKMVKDRVMHKPYVRNAMYSIEKNELISFKGEGVKW